MNFNIFQLNLDNYYSTFKLILPFQIRYYCRINKSKPSYWLLSYQHNFNFRIDIDDLKIYHFLMKIN
jgi:hypothetical protein